MHLFINNIDIQYCWLIVEICWNHFNSITNRINTSTKAKSTLIVNSDSDDDFVVKEQKVQEDETKKKYNDMRTDNDDLNGVSNQEHGALVKKILESKEQLEYGSELNKNKDFVSWSVDRLNRVLKVLRFSRLFVETISAKWFAKEEGAGTNTKRNW